MSSLKSQLEHTRSQWIIRQEQGKQRAATERAAREERERQTRASAAERIKRDQDAAIRAAKTKRLQEEAKKAKVNVFYFILILCTVWVTKKFPFLLIEKRYFTVTRTRNV